MTSLVKPPIGLIDLSHPIARGLDICAPMWEGGGLRVADLAGRRVGTTTASGRWVSTPHGHGINYGDTQHTAFTGGGIDTNGRELTFAALMMTTNATAKGVAFSTTYASANRFMIHQPLAGGVAIAQYNGATTAVTTPALTANTYHMIVGRISDTLGNAIWKDGVKYTAAGSINSHTTVATIIGGRTDGDIEWVGVIGFVYFWLRGLTNGEALSITADPYQFIRPSDSLPLWVAATSGGAAPPASIAVLRRRLESA